MAELEVGYFKQIGKYWVFETYGIGGVGSFENELPSTIEDNPTTEGKISANMLRLGIQPNFGFNPHYSPTLL